MITTLAQAAALTVVGNHWVQGREIGGFWPEAPVFRFCRGVRFAHIRVHRLFGVRIIAGDPLQWLAELKRLDVSRLLLHYVPSGRPASDDQMLAGFVSGGGRWLLEARRPHASDFWEAEWLVGDPHDPQQQIWNVTYHRIAADAAPRTMNARGLPLLRGELDEALTAIEAFAATHGQPLFAQTFRRALDTLRAAPPPALSTLVGPEADAALTLADDARRLLAAAEIAWVFGGMGSWNDLSFDGAAQQTYERLSATLFALLNHTVAETASSAAVDPRLDGASARHG